MSVNNLTESRVSYTLLTELLLWLVYSRANTGVAVVCVCVCVCARACACVSACVNCRAVQEASIYRNTWLRSEDLTEAAHYIAENPTVRIPAGLRLRFGPFAELFCPPQPRLLCIPLEFVLFQTDDKSDRDRKTVEKRQEGNKARSLVSVDCSMWCDS